MGKLITVTILTSPAWLALIALWNMASAAGL